MINMVGSPWSFKFGWGLQKLAKRRDFRFFIKRRVG